MAKILAILANPRRNSHTFKLLQSFLQSYRICNPNDTIDELDLYQAEIPLIDAKVLEAWNKAADRLTVEEETLLAKVDQLTSQFVTADKVVIAAPMWNLQFPPLLTAYIANIVVAGKTFRYTETGWEGLVPDKPVLLLHVRGGIYSEGPARAADHAIPFLKSICELVGIASFKAVICEGIEALPEQAEALFERALFETTQFAKIF